MQTTETELRAPCAIAADIRHTAGWVRLAADMIEWEPAMLRDQQKGLAADINEGIGELMRLANELAASLKGGAE